MARNRFLTSILIGTMGLLLLGTYTRGSAAASPGPRERIDPRATYNTGGGVPGNPSKAIKDLAKLYRGLGVFKTRHGRLPKDAGEFLDDLIPNSRLYGLTSKDLMNPDSRYAANPVARAYPDKVFPFSILSKRPDGTPVGGPHKPGKRDVLAFTDLYSHLKITPGKNAADKVEPLGFSLVLWDDGAVAKIPTDQGLYVYMGKGNYGQAFPGQAGVPESAKTFWEFHKHNARSSTELSPTRSKL